MNNNEIFESLKFVLQEEIKKNNLAGNNVNISCRALSTKEAIGSPEHDDYPIIKGKEVMIEAVFKGAVGQAFTDEFKNSTYPIENLLKIDHSSTPDRASFIAGLNAVFKYLKLCDKTVHCRDKEPVECAKHLITQDKFSGKKILLVGFQPRFLEYLVRQNQVRVLDLDPDNINQERFGVMVEKPESLSNAIAWCDIIFATGSTLVNGTISQFLNKDKPVVFFGVTISAAACILDLNTYCHCGH